MGYPLCLSSTRFMQIIKIKLTFYDQDSCGLSFSYVLLPRVSEGNLVEVVSSIDSTSSYCTAGQITDRYFSLSQLIYTSGLKKQSKENEDFTKLVCSVRKLLGHKHLETLRSLALELYLILHSFLHYKMHCG